MKFLGCGSKTYPVPAPTVTAYTPSLFPASTLDLGVRPGKPFYELQYSTDGVRTFVASCSPPDEMQASLRFDAIAVVLRDDLWLCTACAVSCSSTNNVPTPHNSIRANWKVAIRTRSRPGPSFASSPRNQRWKWGRERSYDRDEHCCGTLRTIEQQ